MADTEEKITDKTFNITGGIYRMEPLSWQQHKWLADHIFKGIDMHRLDYPAIHDLLREKGPLFMAICLIHSSMTRGEHSRQPWQTILFIAEAWAADLTAEEVATFGIRFFRSCLGSPAAMAMLTTGKGMQEAFNALQPPSPAPGENGSSAVSSVSAAETLPSSSASLPSGDQPSLTPISSGASSERPSTAPSLAGSASNSLG